MSYPYRFYAVVTPGLEEVVVKELETLSAHEIKKESGGVYFSGTMETMFRVNLRSRCITRVLLRLKRFTIMSTDELAQKLKEIDWPYFLNHECNIKVHVSCHKSRLMHSANIEQSVVQIVRACGFPPAESGRLQQLYIRIENNRCQLSIDTSGERLDRRGYRLESGKAPVRETVAAGVLQWMGWQPDEPLVIPMCGSGTFAIEAATAGIKQAPGLSHEFPFLQWPGMQQKRWQRALKRTREMTKEVASLPIFASDINAAAVEITKRNAQRAGIEKLIEIKQGDVKELSKPESIDSGVIIFNPPYGQRIDTNVQALYAALGKLCKGEFEGWRVAMFSPDRLHEKQLPLPVKRRLKIKHGGSWIHVLHL